jgi:hypothetical protein
MIVCQRILTGDSWQEAYQHKWASGICGKKLNLFLGQNAIEEVSGWVSRAKDDEGLPV